MDAQLMWALFWATGLPEAAALAAFLEESSQPEEKTA